MIYCFALLLLYYSIGLCDVQKKIGWRSQSRKLVVMSTDASFHYAGDGKVRIYDNDELKWKLDS